MSCFLGEYLLPFFRDLFKFIHKLLQELKVARSRESVIKFCRQHFTKIYIFFHDNLNYIKSFCDIITLASYVPYYSKNKLLHKIKNTYEELKKKMLHDIWPLITYSRNF